MSFYFTIPTTQDLTLQQLLEVLPYPDIRIAASTHYPLDQVLQGGMKLYLPYRSTRGVSLERQDQQYEIGINVGASPDDLQLALTMVAQLAALAEADILPEDQEVPLPHTDFCQTYGNHWITEQALHGLSVIRHMIEDQERTLILNGCVLPFHIGNEFLQHLVYDQPNETTFAERLWSAIQRLQYVDLEREDVSIPDLRQVGETAEDIWTCIAVTPNQTQLLVQADYIIFMLREGAIKIDFEQVQSYAAEQSWERLDEVHYLLPTFSPDDFAELVEQLHDFREVGEPSSDN